MDDELGQLLSARGTDFDDPRQRGRAVLYALAEMDEEQRAIELAHYREMAGAGIARPGEPRGG